MVFSHLRNDYFNSFLSFVTLCREQDEELDSIVVSAQFLLSSLKRNNLTEQNVEDEVDNIVLRASILALFVSDCFGGADRTDSLMRTRRAIVSLTKEQPFVCTCGGVRNEVVNGNCSEHFGVGSPFGGSDFTELCDKSLRFIKERHNSNIVPLGTLRFGVCRHRALLMKVIVIPLYLRNNPFSVLCTVIASKLV